MSNKYYGKYECDRCGELAEAHYTLSHLAKGLWVNCLHCGKHARPYVEGLKLPYIASKAYLKHIGIEKGPSNQVVAIKGEPLPF